MSQFEPVIDREVAGQGRDSCPGAHRNMAGALGGGEGGAQGVDPPAGQRAGEAFPAALV